MEKLRSRDSFSMERCCGFSSRLVRICVLYPCIEGLLLSADTQESLHLPMDLDMEQTRWL